MKLSEFPIIITVVGIVVVLSVGFFSLLGSHSSVVPDTADFQVYNQTQSMFLQAQEINESLQALKSSGNPVDFATDFVTSGWKVIKATFTSLDVSMGLTSATMEKVGVAGGGSYLTAAVLTLVFFLFAFAVVAAILGRDL